MPPRKVAIELKQIIDTRWTCQFAAIDAIKKRFSAILTTLEELSSTSVAGSSDRAITALGLLNQICNFKFVLSLERFHFLFNETSLLAESLQNESIQITKARKLLSSVCHQLQQVGKKSNNWNSIWSKSVVICNNQKIPIEKEVLPTEGIRSKRPRKLPAALDNFLVEASVEQHNDTLDTL